MIKRVFISFTSIIPKSLSYCSCCLNIFSFYFNLVNDFPFKISIIQYLYSALYNNYSIIERRYMDGSTGGILVDDVENRK